MRLRVAGILAGAVLLCTGCASGRSSDTAVPSEGPDPSARPAVTTFEVSVTSLRPARLVVRAELPLRGDTLRLYPSWPCNLDAMCEQGWALLIEGLRVSDPAGRALRADPAGPSGWIVRDASGTRATVEYSVNYATLEEAGWPAPREAAFADGSHLFTLGRALFVGTDSMGPVRVRFVLPEGLQVFAPWTAEADGSFLIQGFENLANNGLVIGPGPLEPVRAGEFTLLPVLFGGWQDHRREVTGVLAAHVGEFTELFDTRAPGAFLAVFFDDPESGGEAFASSYALSGSPDSSVAGWGRLVGHELFHFWNGNRLRGADYTTSQWFQEGVSEYYAILSMSRSGLLPPESTLELLSRRLRGHRAFSGSLAGSGNRKSGAFYGSATMAAFALDLLIRDATDGVRSLDDVMRQLWSDFGTSQRPYAATDVRSAVSAIAGRDLTEFFQRHIDGDEAVPIDRLLPLAGLRTVGTGDAESIALDPTAGPELRRRWSRLAGAD